MSDPYIAKNKFNIKLARCETFMSYKILSERKYLKSANASHADNNGLKRFDLMADIVKKPLRKILNTDSNTK